MYNLLHKYTEKGCIINFFDSILPISLVAFLISFAISMFIGPKIIFLLKTRYKSSQPVREDVLQSHKKKAGTPTMGGVIVIIGSVFTTLMLADLANPYIWIALFTFIAFAFIGFNDDYAKITHNSYKGISARAKFAYQISFSLISCILIYWVKYGDESVSQITVPFVKSLVFDLGYFYIVFGVFMLVGSSNAVNLTDGLDGLAAIPVIISIFVLSIFGYIALDPSNFGIAHILQVTPATSSLIVLSAAVSGSVFAFLWFNCEPAEVFMGDTGSLALGALLGVIAMMIKQEIVLAISGGVFVMETVSVIIQVYYFKLTKGKRFFRMTPIHHHFEKKEWPESKIVIRFWIMSVVFGIIALGSLVF